MLCEGAPVGLQKLIVRFWFHCLNHFAISEFHFRFRAIFTPIIILAQYLVVLVSPRFSLLGRNSSVSSSLHYLTHRMSRFQFFFEENVYLRSFGRIFNHFGEFSILFAFICIMNWRSLGQIFFIGISHRTFLRVQSIFSRTFRHFQNLSEPVKHGRNRLLPVSVDLFIGVSTTIEAGRGGR
jgi:hypothetical protein